MSETKATKKKSGNLSSRKWDEKELETLNNFAGLIPFSELVMKIRYQNYRNRLKPRTAAAVKKKCFDLGLSVSCEGNYFDLMGVAEILGCSKTQINTWLRDSEMLATLSPKKEESGRYRFYFANVAYFVIRYRYEVLETGKPDLEHLLGLFEDLDICNLSLQKEEKVRKELEYAKG
jgi:hypothetical protein